MYRLSTLVIVCVLQIWVRGSRPKFSLQEETILRNPRSRTRSRTRRVSPAPCPADISGEFPPKAIICVPAQTSVRYGGAFAILNGSTHHQQGAIPCEDLFYRLNVIHLIVPPLRERREDIPGMIDCFLQRFVAANRSPVERISDEAIAALTQHGWAGNVRELENIIERIVVVGRAAVIGVNDLPLELHQQPRRQMPMPPRPAAVAAPKPAAHATTVDDLYLRLTLNRESFWTSVYPLYMQREITRTQVRDVVRKGLEEARGNYKIMVELFNMEAQDYKKFLNFLRKHQCQLPFQEYRQITHA